ncbi:MAG: ATP-dependent DNA ligase [Candidatus Bathyarchaeia archaeon]
MYKASEPKSSPFKNLVSLCNRLEKESSRSLKIDLVSSFLKDVSEIDIEHVVYLLLGKTFPEWDGRTLDVSWGILSSVIKRVCSVDDSTLIEAVNETGDLGAATEIVLRDRRVRRQKSLMNKELTIVDVKRSLEALAELVGERSRERKERFLEGLLSSAEPDEAKYIVKIMLGEMRTGFNEGLMESAISKAFKVDEEAVRRAVMLTGDLGEVAKEAKLYGIDGVKSIKIMFFRPIKPMLAQNADSLSDAIKMHDGKTALEFKLDGVRVQIHKLDNNVKIFSRRLTDVTSIFPEVRDVVKMRLRANNAVVEGEVIALGNDGAPLPFQYLMRRFRRNCRFGEAFKGIWVNLFLFDALLLNGEVLIDLPYTERRKRLSEVCAGIPLTKQLVTRDLKQAREFFEEAVKQGHEGVIAKNLDSRYVPGVRGKNWLKVKKTLDPLDLVIIAAEYGYGRRHRWLSDYYLAARSEEDGKFYVVGKTFKGLTDKEMAELTDVLEEISVRREARRVYVKPKVVAEVLYNEIQKSPKYESGLALRFARISRIRYDKDISSIDTISRVREMYEKQFEKKSKYS